MRKKAWSLLFSLMAISTLVVGIGFARGYDSEGVVDSAVEVHGGVHHRHGGTSGHLSATSENVRLIGKMNINQDVEGRVADVGIYGNYAYLAAFNERDCQKGGVYVFDISNVAAPKQVNFIRTANDSFVGEGVQVIHLETAAYNGDLLVFNNEICTGQAGNTNQQAVGGMTLVDVTNPKQHKYLARSFGDYTPGYGGNPAIANRIHSAFAWQAGSKAYVVMVDDEEGTDVDIVDITDPRRPVLIAEYDFDVRFPQIIQSQLGSSSSFLHDMIVKQINDRYILLASYWDGGYVTVDLTDPYNPTYLGDNDFTSPDPEAALYGFTVKPEGNGHQAEFSKNSDYIVAADEDFNPYSIVARNIAENTEFRATQGSNTPQINNSTTLTGQTVFVGRACPGDAAVPANGGGKIALVERGLCTFTEKLASVEAASGYAGVIIFNRVGSDGCSDLLSMDVQGTIPALFVSRATGFSLLNGTPEAEATCRAATVPGASDYTSPFAIGAAGDAVDIKAVFDGWGYVHLFANKGGKLQELDTYAIPESFDPANATGKGDLSVHEVAMSARSNTLAYFSYYAGGFRVAQIENGKLVERGRFIDQGGNNFWGVQVFEQNGREYVAASDRDYGVYIFEYTGPGKVNP